MTKINSIDTARLDVLKTLPPKLSIAAIATVGTSGWRKGQLLPRFSNSDIPLNGIYEFDFVADAPDGEVLHVLSRISALYIFSEIPKNFRKAVIYSETNMKELLITSDKLTDWNNLQHQSFSQGISCE